MIQSGNIFYTHQAELCKFVTWSDNHFYTKAAHILQGLNYELLNRF